MASRWKFRRDRAGIRTALHQMGPAVTAEAHLIAATAEQSLAGRFPVKVQPYTSDRSAASVQIAHPAGLAIEGKHGTLVKAARARRHDVHGKKP